ncbi:hypothetical protein ACVWZR_004432 [Bradyrhizobium sp. i1.3.1]
MTHRFPDFTSHVLDLLKNTGPSGPTGPTLGKPFIPNEKAGTSREAELGPVDFDWSHHDAVTGPGKYSTDQALNKRGTTGTSGTTNFAGGEDDGERGGAPSEWHAILGELERRNCPEWMSLERWDLLLGDAESFLSRWGRAAHAMGWTALDLYGVHPLVPASRFDVMGFLFLIQGGGVPVITGSSASVHRQTGAHLTYRRHDTSGAVLITKVLV